MEPIKGPFPKAQDSTGKDPLLLRKLGHWPKTKGKITLFVRIVETVRRRRGSGTLQYLCHHDSLLSPVSCPTPAAPQRQPSSEDARAWTAAQSGGAGFCGIPPQSQPPSGFHLHQTLPAQRQTDLFSLEANPVSYLRLWGCSLEAANILPAVPSAKEWMHRSHKYAVRRTLPNQSRLLDQGTLPW